MSAAHPSCMPAMRRDQPFYQRRRPHAEVRSMHVTVQCMCADAGRGRWVEHGRRFIYESDWVKLGFVDVSLPSGHRFEHHVVWLRAAAIVVVLDDKREHILLAWRHRFVPDTWNWELPGGVIDEGEQPVDTAAREVEEETGYRPRQLEHAVTFEPMIGMVSSPHHVFVAYGAELVGRPEELDEGTYEWVPLARVRELIARGEITNSGTLVGLLHVLADVGTAK